MTGGAPEPGATPHSAPSLIAAGLKGLCPQCGDRTLFAGTARFAKKCPTCGLDFSALNVGDGPAVFLILIIGTVICVGAIMVDLAFNPPLWVHLVWLPVAIGLTFGGLRIGKAALAYQEYRHRAHEGRIVP